MISYIIVFTLLIVGVIIWQLSSKKRFLRLSYQELPELVLSILISKKERKIDRFIIRVIGKKEFEIQKLKIELISDQREFTYIPSDEFSDTRTYPIKINNSESMDIDYSYDKLKDMITTKASNLHSFRIVLELGNNKVYKSHELKFDKLWKIYRSDTGRYN